MFSYKRMRYGKNVDHRRFRAPFKMFIYLKSRFCFTSSLRCYTIVYVYLSAFYSYVQCSNWKYLSWVESFSVEWVSDIFQSDGNDAKNLFPFKFFYSILLYIFGIFHVNYFSLLCALVVYFCIRINVIVFGTSYTPNTKTEVKKNQKYTSNYAIHLQKKQFFFSSLLLSPIRCITPQSNFE